MESSFLQKLLFLESIFNENEFLEGEERYDTLSDSIKIKKQRSKFLISIEEKEIEVSIKKGKLVFAAEPPTPKNKPRVDEVVSAIALRKFLQDAEIAKKNQVRKRRSTKKSDQILDKIPHEQLILFLRRYARKDPHFEIKLLSNFILQYSDAEHKYDKVLEKIIKPKSEHSPKLPQKSLQTFYFMLESFKGQAEDLYSLQKFDELLPLLIACIKKTAYASKVYEINQDKLEAYNSTFHDILDRMCKQELAPSFAVSVLNHIVEIVTLSYYFPKKITNSAYHTLYKHPLLDKANIVEILDALKLKFARSEKIGRLPLQTTAAMLASRYASTCETYFEYWNNQEHIHVLQNLLDLGCDEACDVLTGKLQYTEGLEKDLALVIAEKELRIGNEKSAIKHYLKWINYKPKVFELIKRLERINPEILDESGKALYQQLGGYKIEEQAKVLSRLALHTQLKSLLQEHMRLDIMQHYDKSLLIEDADFVKMFYTSWIKKYLIEHFGDKSVQQVGKVINHLKSIGMKQFSESLKSELKKEFNERKSLKNQITL